MVARAGVDQVENEDAARDPVTTAALITIPEAQRRLARRDEAWRGDRGEKLLRYLRARERALKATIIIEIPSPKRVARRVNWHNLQRRCPELFDQHRRVRMSDDMREALRDFIQAEVSASLRERVEPKHKELWKRDAALLSRVEQLEQAAAAPLAATNVEVAELRSRLDRLEQLVAELGGQVAA